MVSPELVTVKPLMEMVQKPWAKFLSQEVTPEERQSLQKHERTGRPLGSGQFIKALEKKLGRKLALDKPGPKPKKK